MQFKHLSTEHGLNHDHTTTIYKDRLHGLVWIGTLEGLNRFNGNRIERVWLTEDKRDSTFKIAQLFEDSLHRLWVVCEQNAGVFYIDLYTGKTIEYSSKFPNIIPADYILIKGKYMYIGSGRGLKIHNMETGVVRMLEYNPADTTGPGANGVPHITMDKQGNLWMPFWNYGIAKFDPRTEKFTHYPKHQSSLHGGPWYITWRLKLDTTRNILWGIEFLGANLFAFDLNTQTFKHFKASIPNLRPTFWNVDIDSDGHLWLATRRQGLIHFDPDNNRFFVYTRDIKDKSSLADYRVGNVYLDGSRLWLNYINSGVSYSFLKKNKIRKYTFKDVLTNEDVYDICYDGSNRVFILDTPTIYEIDYTKNRLTSYPGRYKHIIKSNLKNKIFAVDTKENLVEINAENKQVNVVDFVHWLHPKQRSAIRQINQDMEGNYWVIWYDYVYQVKMTNGKCTDTTLIAGPLRTDDVIEFKSRIFRCDSIVYVYDDYRFFIFQYKQHKLVCTFKHIYQEKSLKEKRGAEIIFAKDEPNGILLFNTKSQIWADPTKNTFTLIPNPYIRKTDLAPKISEVNDSLLLINTYRGTTIVNRYTKKVVMPRFLTILDINPDQLHVATPDYAFVGCNNGVIQFNPIAEFTSDYETGQVVVTRVMLGNEDFFNLYKMRRWVYTNDTIYLPAGKQSLSIEMSLLNYDLDDANQFVYFLHGYDQHWVQNGNRKVATYTNLNAGIYRFEYYAIDKYGNKSPSKTIFIIKAPHWYETWWAKLPAVLSVIVGIWGLFKWRLYGIRKRNKLLESIVKERTQEIVEQKRAIEEQEQRIKELYQDVTDSIQTAKRIQESILPPPQLWRGLLPRSFVYYVPKDIVSGDFFWIHETRDAILVAAVDCTGHGVAGAFMSLIAAQSLHAIMRENPLLSPKVVLDRLNERIIHTLHQNTENPISKDGMDMALCKIYKGKNIVEFSGANNPLYYIEPGGELQIVKGNNNSIGIQPYGKISTFDNHTISYAPGTIFYIFSDGYTSQFGGPYGTEKFKASRFRALIQEIHTLDVKVQHAALDERLQRWMHGTVQTDDVMVIGFIP